MILATVPQLLVLAASQEGPAPEDVKAGWLGFGVWLALAAALVFLAFSLVKHLKKVNFDDGSGPAEGEGPGRDADTPDPHRSAG
jgi:hypothetical protein